MNNRTHKIKIYLELVDITPVTHHYVFLHYYLKEGAFSCNLY